ncbi:HEPN domain-containing protein, partial [Endothiovibrio diazotrophicus]
PEERLGRGLHNFHYWFNSASDFWQGSGYYMAQGKNAPAAFMLHQSVERFYHALTLIYSGYKHKVHNLSKLAEVGESMHEALLDALPREEEADKARFDLLKRAYIEARYSKSYRISEEELTVLRAQVLDLAERVLLACREKLASFCGAEAVGELPSLPEDGEVPELPPLPDIEDRAAMEDWGRLVATSQWESGRETGASEGRERGLSEGLERGREEGREQGLAEGVRKVAVALLAKGMATEAVAEATGLSVEEIGALEAGLAVGSDEESDRGF